MLSLQISSYTPGGQTLCSVNSEHVTDRQSAQNTISISSLSVVHKQKCQFAWHIKVCLRVAECLSVSPRVCLETGSGWHTQEVWIPCPWLMQLMWQQPAINVSLARFNSDQHSSSSDAVQTKYPHVASQNVSKTSKFMTDYWPLYSVSSPEGFPNEAHKSGWMGVV